MATFMGQDVFEASALVLAGIGARELREQGTKFSLDSLMDFGGMLKECEATWPGDALARPQIRDTVQWLLAARPYPVEPYQYALILTEAYRRRKELDEDLRPKGVGARLFPGAIFAREHPRPLDRVAISQANLSKVLSEISQPHAEALKRLQLTERKVHSGALAGVLRSVRERCLLDLQEAPSEVSKEAVTAHAVCDFAARAFWALKRRFEVFPSYPGPSDVELERLVLAAAKPLLTHRVPEDLAAAVLDFFISETESYRSRRALMSEEDFIDSFMPDISIRYSYSGPDDRLASVLQDNLDFSTEATDFLLDLSAPCADAFFQAVGG